MQIPFTKMHGLGNDFVVFDAITTPICLTSDQLRWIADRHLGIGCDQILLVEQSTLPGVDFRYRIFNADGHEVQQCGNGARCFARFVREKGLTQKDRLVVETQKGLIYPTIEANGEVTVNMGLPRWLPVEIPFVVDKSLESTDSLQYKITVETTSYNISVVSMGNPHAVLIVDSVANAPVATIGKQLECHPRFPERVNVGFMQILNRSEIRLRVFERGVGETLACGTGACAAVVAGRRLGWLDTPVIVHLSGGQLHIEWAGTPDAPVFMTGAAVRVFEGIIEI